MKKISNLKFQSSKFWKIIVFVLLVSWLGFLCAQKIDLVTADLGRHIKNGELLVSSGFDLSSNNPVLHSNFYAYTHPDYPFLNHHWATGIVFYLVYSVLGFAGLSVLNTALTLITFAIFFYVAHQESDYAMAAVFSFFLIPLAAERTEIRPEIWSYFFAGLFFLILWLWEQGKISFRGLFVLPLFMILWVNLHIYFILGFFLVGVFWTARAGKIILLKLTDDEFKKQLTGLKWLTSAFVLTILGSFLNPSGFRGALHPFKIYTNYGYTVLEEKSVWFLENYGVMNPNFLTVKGVLVLFVAGLVLLVAVNRKSFSFRYLILAIFFGAIGWMALRNFTLLGFFALPALSYFFGRIFRKKEGDVNVAREYGITILFVSMGLLGLYGNYKYVSAHHENFGLGLRPGVQSAAEFIKEKNIHGPIFNNYDIGGYLIFHLYPEEKVFVDNRPEAYPEEFFGDVYKSMQGDKDVFQKVDEKYDFNAIVFYRNDITPWARKFFEDIQNFEDWARVYEDGYAIIFLKRNEKNQVIIERNEIRNLGN